MKQASKSQAAATRRNGVHFIDFKRCTHGDDLRKPSFFEFKSRTEGCRTWHYETSLKARAGLAYWSLAAGHAAGMHQPKDEKKLFQQLSSARTQFQALGPRSIISTGFCQVMSLKVSYSDACHGQSQQEGYVGVASVQGPANDKVSRMTRLFWEPKFSAPAFAYRWQNHPCLRGTANEEP